MSTHVEERSPIKFFALTYLFSWVFAVASAFASLIAAYLIKKQKKYS